MKYRHLTEPELRSRLEQLQGHPKVLLESADTAFDGEYMARLVQELQIHQVELELQNRELQKTQQELEESHHRYVDLFDFAPLGYVTLSKQGAIREINRAATLMLGKESKHLIGRHLGAHVVPEDRKRFQEHLWQCSKSDEAVTTEFRLIQPGKTHLAVQVRSMAAYDPRHQSLVYRTAITDISERKQIEDRLQASHNELERRVLERTRELEAANQALQREILERTQAEAEVRRLNASLEQRVAERTRELESFSYSISHDLRAPLRAIDGFSLILLREHGESLQEQARHHLARVRAGAQRMGQLIDGLLSLSRITRAPQRADTVNVSEMALQILEQQQALQPHADGRQVEFAVMPDIKVTGDAALLYIMLENLLGNAWKFSRNVAQARIEFGCIEQEDGQVYFVRDNGAGFDMQYADKLFTPFQRLHAMHEFEGTGIGLATVARIIHRHNGRVWTEGSINQGATFFFTLNP